MILSQILTLYIAPITHTHLEAFRLWVGNHLRRKEVQGDVLSAVESLKGREYETATRSQA